MNEETTSASRCIKCDNRAELCICPGGASGIVPADPQPRCEDCGYTDCRCPRVPGTLHEKVFASGVSAPSASLVDALRDTIALRTDELDERIAASNKLEQSAREVTGCVDCPMSTFVPNPGTGAEYRCGDKGWAWQEHRWVDEEFPDWCPLKSGPVLVRLKSSREV